MSPVEAWRGSRKRNAPTSAVRDVARRWTLVLVRRWSLRTSERSRSREDRSARHNRTANWNQRPLFRAIVYDIILDKQRRAVQRWPGAMPVLDMRYDKLGMKLGCAELRT